MHRNYWLAAAAFVVAGLVALYFLSGKAPSSASENGADNRAMVLPFDPQQLVVETAKGERSFTIEIADSEDERQRGLMFRLDMDDDHGMLFVFEEQREVGFWMKDTPMALDLVFIGQDGVIKAVRQGEPLSEALITAGQPVRFVLELKAGIAASNDIERGDRVRHKAINQAPGPAMPAQE
jgi:uncharacterized membrane protein (UPF0127 family)